jgi:hypothetical protein
MLFDIYARQHLGATMLNPDKLLKLSLPLVAFADNTNLLRNENSQQQPIDELIKEAHFFGI